jgi:hypothetical protein
MMGMTVQTVRKQATAAPNPQISIFWSADSKQYSKHSKSKTNIMSHHITEKKYTQNHEHIARNKHTPKMSLQPTHLCNSMIPLWS